VERDRELDGSEVRRQVPARLRDAPDQERAQLAREVAQLRAIEEPQVAGPSIFSSSG